VPHLRHHVRRRLAERVEHRREGAPQDLYSLVVDRLRARAKHER
jgi:hypothetical protein